AYEYWPLATREEYSARLIDDVLAAAPDRTAVLAQFFSEMDPDEATKLRQVLSKAKRKPHTS
ncbi:BlaI/MecI/CopY family transcriptional regulator, partial [Amycolatopsis palatopharyngis]|uniref:BlaI/MecI/CopY family transcriptional regulator n=1 Tax=Amycolatopsis palatopharyngis TaxID=187982 RepID=UPI0013BE8EA9